MRLEEFVTYVEASLDTNSEASLQAMTPHLRSLGRNTRFLPEYLVANMAKAEYQQDNSYAGSAIILARGPGWTIRVAAWTALEDAPHTPSGSPLHVYAEEDDDSELAHTHTFALLTYGMVGPGYRTDLYDCDPEELKRTEIGETVTLGPKRTEQLRPDTVMYYPPCRVAHAQHPPDDYSISLNLIVEPPNSGREQYFIRTRDNVLVAANGPAEAETTLELAKWLPREQSAPLLTTIVKTHPLRSVRNKAAGILAAF